MPDKDKQLQAKLANLEKDVSDLKTDIRSLKNLLIQINKCEEDEEKKKELKKIESTLL